MKVHPALAASEKILKPKVTRLLSVSDLSVHLPLGGEDGCDNEPFPSLKQIRCNSIRKKFSFAGKCENRIGKCDMM